MPLLLEQYGYFPNGGAILGQINWKNAVSVIGTPFGIRVGTPLNVWSVAGAVIMLGAALALLLARGRERVAHRELVVALGAVGVVGLFGLDLTGKHILITRYTAVTAPFLATALAAACAVLPRAAAVVFALATLTVSVAGLVVNHSPGGFYAPARQVVAYLAPRERPNDFMLTPGYALTDVPIRYYDTHRLKPKLHLFGLPDPRARRVLRTVRHLWLVDSPASATTGAAIAIVNRRLRAHRFHVVSVKLFTTSITLAVIRAAR
jgi:hypothetical protein